MHMKNLAIDFLSRLEGMFAVAVWDRVRHRLIVARDPLGIKPLYFRRVPTELAFSSEAKAILALPDVGANLDLVSLEQYLAVGYVPAPNSMFAGISKLEPGTAIIVDRGAIRLHRFHEFQLRDRFEPIAGRLGRRDSHGGREGSTCADGFGRAHRRVSERRNRFKRSRGIHVRDTATGPVGRIRSASRGRLARNSTTSCPMPGRWLRAFDTDHQRDPRTARRCPLAAGVALAHGRTGRRRGVHHDLSRVQVRATGRHRHPVRRRRRRAVWRIHAATLTSTTAPPTGACPLCCDMDCIRPLAAMLPSDRHSRLLNKLRLAKAFMQADGLPFEARYRAFMQVFDRRSAYADACAGDRRTRRRLHRARIQIDEI